MHNHLEHGTSDIVSGDIEQWDSGGDVVQEEEGKLYLEKAKERSLKIETSVTQDADEIEWRHYLAKTADAELLQRKNTKKEEALGVQATNALEQSRSDETSQDDIKTCDKLAPSLNKVKRDEDILPELKRSKMAGDTDSHKEMRLQEEAEQQWTSSWVDSGIFGQSPSFGKKNLEFLGGVETVAEGVISTPAALETIGATGSVNCTTGNDEILETLARLSVATYPQPVLLSSVQEDVLRVQQAVEGQSYREAYHHSSTENQNELIQMAEGGIENKTERSISLNEGGCVDRNYLGELDEETLLKVKSTYQAKSQCNQSMINFSSSDNVLTLTDIPQKSFPVSEKLQNAFHVIDADKFSEGDLKKSSQNYGNIHVAITSDKKEEKEGEESVQVRENCWKRSDEFVTGEKMQYEVNLNEENKLTTGEKLFIEKLGEFAETEYPFERAAILSLTSENKDSSDTEKGSNKWSFEVQECSMLKGVQPDGETANIFKMGEDVETTDIHSENDQCYPQMECFVENRLGGNINMASEKLGRVVGELTFRTDDQMSEAEHISAEKTLSEIWEEGTKSGMSGVLKDELLKFRSEKMDGTAGMATIEITGLKNAETEISPTASFFGGGRMLKDTNFKTELKADFNGKKFKLSSARSEDVQQKRIDTDSLKSKAVGEAERDKTDLLEDNSAPVFESASWEGIEIPVEEMEVQNTGEIKKSQRSCDVVEGEQRFGLTCDASFVKECVNSKVTFLNSYKDQSMKEYETFHEIKKNGKASTQAVASGFLNIIKEDPLIRKQREHSQFEEGTVKFKLPQQPVDGISRNEMKNEKERKGLTSSNYPEKHVKINVVEERAPIRKEHVEESLLSSSNVADDLVKNTLVTTFSRTLGTAAAVEIRSGAENISANEMISVSKVSAVKEKWQKESDIRSCDAKSLTNQESSLAQDTRTPEELGAAKILTDISDDLQSEHIEEHKSEELCMVGHLEAPPVKGSTVEDNEKSCIHLEVLEKCSHQPELPKYQETCKRVSSFSVVSPKIVGINLKSGGSPREEELKLLEVVPSVADHWVIKENNLFEKRKPTSESLSEDLLISIETASARQGGSRKSSPEVNRETGVSNGVAGETLLLARYADLVSDQLVSEVMKKLINICDSSSSNSNCKSNSRSNNSNGDNSSDGNSDSSGSSNSIFSISDEKYNDSKVLSFNEGKTTEKQLLEVEHDYDFEVSRKLEKPVQNTKSFGVNLGRRTLPVGEGNYEEELNIQVAQLVDDILKKIEGNLSHSSYKTATATSRDGYDTCLTSQEDTFETAPGWHSQESEYTTANSIASSRVSEISFERHGSITPIAMLSPVHSDRLFTVSQDEEQEPTRQTSLAGYSKRSTPDMPDIEFEHADDEGEMDENVLLLSSSGILFAPEVDPVRPISPIPPGLVEETEGTVVVPYDIFKRGVEQSRLAEIKVLDSILEAPGDDALTEEILSVGKVEVLKGAVSPNLTHGKATDFDSKFSDASYGNIVSTVDKIGKESEITSGMLLPEAVLPGKSDSLDSLDKISIKSGSSGKRHSTSRRSSTSSRKSQHDESQTFFERLTPELKITWKESDQVGQSPKQFSPSEEFSVYMPVNEQMHSIEVELETVDEEPEEADSLNGKSISSNGLGTDISTTAGKYKTTSSDNVSETSLQEFERIERDVLNKGESSLSGSEMELYVVGKFKAADGSTGSLAEFERLEQEVVTEGSPQEEVMVLSDIREESEIEEMSIRDDDDDNDENDSIPEIKVVPVDENIQVATPLASPADSIEKNFEKVISNGFETSTDSLEVNVSAQTEHNMADKNCLVEFEIENMHEEIHDSLEAIPQHKDSISEGANLQGLKSQDTQTLLCGDVLSGSTEYLEEEDSLGGDVDIMFDSYPTTVTTFETTQINEDGSTEIILRRVLTRVTDPVINHVQFTGTENEYRLRDLERVEEFETVDAEGNVTRTTLHRTVPSLPPGTSHQTHHD